MVNFSIYLNRHVYVMLLFFHFLFQVSSQNGSGKISAEANTNPLYELSNSSGDIMASEPTNPLYEISNDTQNQDLKSASVNPLYDFVENEKAVENQTNGHSEDLLGTTDTNEVDLLGDLGPITSDDSGVTMDTNNLDGTHGEVTEEQRSVESSEDSDTQVCILICSCQNEIQHKLFFVNLCY